MILQSDRKYDRIILVGRKRSCLKESGVMTQGRRKVEVDILLLDNGKNNVIADKFFFLLFFVNNNYYFLLANADLLKISIFIFFDKTYLQKPHYIMIENISSNKL